MSVAVLLGAFAVLLSFLFFGRLLGAAGLLLAVPAAVFLKTSMDESLPEDPPEEGERPLGPIVRSVDDRDRITS